MSAPFTLVQESMAIRVGVHGIILFRYKKKKEKKIEKKEKSRVIMKERKKKGFSSYLQPPHHRHPADSWNSSS